MKLRSKFILSVSALYLVLVTLAAFLWKYDKTLFVGSEVLILISIYITINLYRSYVKPLDMFAAGIESIKQKDFSVKFVKSGHYEVDLLIDLYNQMIDKLREERTQLQERHYFLEKLVEASPSAIIILDFESKILSLNPSAKKIFHRSDQLKGYSLIKADPKIGPELEKIAAGSSKIISIDGVHTFKAHKGQFLEKGFYQQFLIIEELTNEILKAEKKAYEKVIRMMSHEVNNSVGAINSIMHSLLTLKPKLNPEESEDYDNALKVSIDRNISMSKFMSRFADVVRLPEPRIARHNLHSFLDNITVLIQGWCKEKNIELVKAYQGEWLIEMDEQQMEQVLINICKNALESINSNGVLTIITNPEQGILIVRDTGKGISKEVSEKLFSPFFSNKKEGQGIGLTLTKEILLNHGFSFRLETKPEGWTEFEIKMK